MAKAGTPTGITDVVQVSSDGAVPSGGRETERVI